MTKINHPCFTQRRYTNTIFLDNATISVDMLVQNAVQRLVSVAKGMLRRFFSAAMKTLNIREASLALTRDRPCLHKTLLRVQRNTCEVVNHRLREVINGDDVNINA